MSRLLLLSNSRSPQGYLIHAQNEIKAFFGKVKQILFIPYAAVSVTQDEYEKVASDAFQTFGYKLVSIHRVKDVKKAVREAEAFAVAGGNTFVLMDRLYKAEILDLMRERIKEDVPYMGWSAGSNIAGPTIKTTNDMPIVQPPSFNALNGVPFQINPHFVEADPLRAKGQETREDRIREFLVMNPDVFVVGLWEGSWLVVEGEKILLRGLAGAKLFRSGQDPRVYPFESDMSFLLKK